MDGQDEGTPEDVVVDEEDLAKAHSQKASSRTDPGCVIVHRDYPPCAFR